MMSAAADTMGVSECGAGVEIEVRGLVDGAAELPEVPALITEASDSSSEGVVSESLRCWTKARKSETTW